ncbi:MAG: acyltransferase [Chthoniobacterales bacterium]
MSDLQNSPIDALTHGNAQHLQRIDVLRALAILCVFLLHWYGHAFGTDHLRWRGWVLDADSGPNAAFYWFIPLGFGWMGVPLFFVISGFCIHASALKRKRLRVRDFLWRRFWRIYPPYVAALVLSIWLARADISSASGRAQVWSHLLLIHNWRPEWIFALNGVFWSLAVEAQLYLLYPLLWKLRERWGIAATLKFTLLISLVTRGICAWFFTDWAKDLAGVVWRSPAMLWFDWTLGAFLAERFLAGRRAFPINAAWRWCSLACVGLSAFTKASSIFTFSLASIFFALCCDAYLNRTQRISQMERLLVPVGLCSYSFYLIHFPLIPLIAGQLRRLPSFYNPAVLTSAAPIGIAIVFAFSFAAYSTLEKGSVAIGRRLRSLRRKGDSLPGRGQRA